MTNARGLQNPYPGDGDHVETLPGILLVYSALTGVSVPPVVLRKGPGLLGLEAQTSRGAVTGFRGAQELGKEGEGVGMAGPIPAFTVNTFRPREGPAV